MYFEQVEIQNFKSIRDMNIEFAPGVNLLIGDNGVGKTSILEALTVALGGYLDRIPEVPTKTISQTDVRITQTPMADASIDVSYATPVRIHSWLDINGVKHSWVRTRKDESGNSKTRTIARMAVEPVDEQIREEKLPFPLLSYLSTSRVFAAKRGDFGSALKKKLTDRRRGYIGCLDDVLDIKAIKSWCEDMEVAAFQLNKPIREYELFKDTVSLVMQKMSGLEKAPRVFYSRIFKDIVYDENGTSLPITYLSAGYQSLLWITMNLAYRAALLNPEIEDLKETTGIVLIDELDMHLHPRWQWNALEALQEAFPKVQFIVATHSAILISSCKNGKLIKIGDDQEIEYLPSAYAYSIGDVLEFRQTSTALPVEVKALSRKFEEALDDDDYELARTIYNEMLEKYGSDNSEVKSAKFELDLDLGEDEG